MNITTRKTHACTLDTLDEELKAGIRAHGAKYGLDDIESGILMCGETLSVRHKKGLLVVSGRRSPQSMSLQSG